MTRNEMIEALYHEMKDVLSPGSARALAERVMKLVEANGLENVIVPTIQEVIAEQAAENVPMEDPVAEVTATVMKAEEKKSRKKLE